MTERRLGALLPWMLLGLMVLAFAAGFSWLSILRHEAFQSHAFDLGNMDQAVWNTLHGRMLRFTDMAVGSHVLTDRLAIHVEPILPLLSLLYLIHSGPETLLVVQACVVSLGAIPAYLLAREGMRRDWLALAFPLAYLLHPSLQNAVLDDFHPVTLSACFLLWAMYFAWSARLLPFVVTGVLAMSTKEDIGLLIGLLGLVFIARRLAVPGAVVVILGFAWFLVCIAVIIPHFNPQGHSPYLARYGYLGHGFAGMVRGATTHPGLVAGVLISSSRQAFLRGLLHPLGFTSILGLPIVLLAAPSFAIDMLSADPTMSSGLYQYAAEIVPYVVAAGTLGTVWVSNRAIRQHIIRPDFIPVALSALVVAASLVATWLDGFSPLAYGYTIPSAGPHQRLEQQILRDIPRQAVVAAADEIEPHLSDRPTIYLLPTIHPRNGPPARYIVVDASVPSLPVRPRTLMGTVQRALTRGYGVVRANDGILLLRRAGRRRHLPVSFYNFVFAPPSHLAVTHAFWGALRLAGVVAHPGNEFINPARPAVSVETYWRAARHLPPRARIAFYISPTYTGPHPAFSPAWHISTDSPTWDWLPLRRWPLGREIHAASLPLLPELSRAGKVDAAVGVFGLGPAHGAARNVVAGAPELVRVATVRVGD